jgi:hypothetical protein
MCERFFAVLVSGWPTIHEVTSRPSALSLIYCFLQSPIRREHLEEGRESRVSPAPLLRCKCPLASPSIRDAPLVFGSGGVTRNIKLQQHVRQKLRLGDHRVMSSSKSGWVQIHHGRPAHKRNIPRLHRLGRSLTIILLPTTADTPGSGTQFSP